MGALLIRRHVHGKSKVEEREIDWAWDSMQWWRTRDRCGKPKGAAKPPFTQRTALIIFEGWMNKMRRSLSLNHCIFDDGGRQWNNNLLPPPRIMQHWLVCALPSLFLERPASWKVTLVCMQYAFIFLSPIFLFLFLLKKIIVPFFHLILIFLQV